MRTKGKIIDSEDLVLLPYEEGDSAILIAGFGIRILGWCPRSMQYSEYKPKSGASVEVMKEAIRMWEETKT